MSMIRMSAAIPPITALQIATASLAVPKSVMKTNSGRATARCPAPPWPFFAGSDLEHAASISEQANIKNARNAALRRDLIKDSSVIGIPQRQENSGLIHFVGVGKPLYPEHGSQRTLTRRATQTHPATQISISDTPNGWPAFLCCPAIPTCPISPSRPSLHSTGVRVQSRERGQIPDRTGTCPLSQRTGFFHRTVPEDQAKISPSLSIPLRHCESVIYSHFHKDMAVLGDSFTSNFGATVPFPSNPFSCLMGQVRSLDPLVKGSHPNRVGRFEAVVQISLGRQQRGAGQNEHTGSESQMDLVVSGDNRRDATLFRARTAGGFRDFHSRFCRNWSLHRHAVYGPEDLGGGSCPVGSQPEPDDFGRAAQRCLG